MEERRQARNQRNRLYYTKHKEAIRQRRAQEDPQKRKEYYTQHKDTICENQRKNFKKRQTANRVKELNDLSAHASEAVKGSILKLLESPELITKHDVNCIKKLVEKSE